jgi:hypothetical protein
MGDSGWQSDQNPNPIKRTPEKARLSNGEFLGEYAGGGCNSQLYQAYRLLIHSELKLNRANRWATIENGSPLKIRIQASQRRGKATDRRRFRTMTIVLVSFELKWESLDVPHKALLAIDTHHANEMRAWMTAAPNPNPNKPRAEKTDTQTEDAWANTHGGGVICSCIKHIGCVSKPKPKSNLSSSWATVYDNPLQIQIRKRRFSTMTIVLELLELLGSR